MSTAFVSVGTNIGNRAQNIKNAVDALNLVPGTKVLALSNIYETLPWGGVEQPNFLNGVIKIETALSPHALLGTLLGIEAAMGRVRTIKNGPRVLDLDLLTFDSEVINSDELTVPHPFMLQREFVLKPLIELDDNEIYINALENLKQGEVWLYEA